MTFPHVVRNPLIFVPDKARTIVKRFIPGGGRAADGTSRLDRILARILSLEESEVEQEWKLVLERFEHRHENFRGLLEEHFDSVVHAIRHPEELSECRRALIGAYFTHEYAVEAAALSNPSLVLSPDQFGLEEGECRIVVSLRSIGEGHISSIQFRTGTISCEGKVALDAPGPHLVAGRQRSPLYEKQLFHQKLTELRVYGDIAAGVLSALPEEFTMDELNRQIAHFDHRDDDASEASRATRALHWLAASNYETVFPDSSQISERILFPSSPTESSGMEDARFVRFVEDDGSVTYFATYTAYDGYQILPQLLQTQDFRRFRITTLNGACAKNKGIALFPRRLKGRFAALARLDNENNFLMTSENARFWHEAQLIQRPTHSWGLTQVGNCGSPLETASGWLVITHEVGPMRRYVLGAMLLDIEDPSRVIGVLREPLLEPNEGERDGYVPNVVYSCGGLVVGERLFVPYGFSDCGAGIATVDLGELLAELERSPVE